MTFPNNSTLPLETTIYQQVIHQLINGKYRVVFERAAVKDRDGFKVEANGDIIENVVGEAYRLYDDALAKTEVKKND